MQAPRRVAADPPQRGRGGTGVPGSRQSRSLLVAMSVTSSVSKGQDCRTSFNFNGEVGDA